MTSSASSAVKNLLQYHGPLTWATLRGEVAQLASIEPPNRPMLDGACIALNSISEAEWKAMADVTVDVELNGQIRKVGWTKCLCQSIILARMREYVRFPFFYETWTIELTTLRVISELVHSIECYQRLSSELDLAFVPSNSLIAIPSNRTLPDFA